MLAPLLPQQTNGDPFPSLILEVGHSQSIANLIGIRDRILSSQTAINVFVLIAYNRNSTRQSDTWYMQIAVKDHFAPPSPPGMHIPRSSWYTKPPKSELTIPKSIHPSHKERRSTIWIPAIFPTPSPSPTSMLLFPRRFRLISSRFEVRFSITAVHE
jgi:hypothetical protein